MNPNVNNYYGMSVLNTLVAKVADLLKSPGLPPTTVTGLDAILRRLSHELSGRKAMNNEDLDLSMAYQAILRIPHGAALVSFKIIGDEMDLDYVPAHLATMEHDDTNQAIWLLKVTRTGKILVNDNKAVAEFTNVWDACCAGTERIIVGVKAFRELLPEYRNGGECLAQVLPSR